MKKISLAEWSTSHSGFKKEEVNNKTRIYIGPNDKGYRELFNLTDYYFSALLSGPCAELIRRDF